MRWVLGLLRIALGALFLYAAVTKLGDMRLFAEEVANYQLLPARLVPLVAAALPGVEIVAGGALLAGLLAREAAVLIAAMLVAFTVGLSLSLSRGVDLRCGCFGGTDPATWWTVGRDLGMLAVALLVLRAGPGRLSLAAAWASLRARRPRR